MRLTAICQESPLWEQAQQSLQAEFRWREHEQIACW
jgi:hypothetical protein